jgi:nitrite reductase/ring-hydroxylating ferredoxin subunit
MRALGAVADIPPGTAKALEPGLFAIGMIDRVMIYLNACPHLGVPLDWLPGRFLSADGQKIICAMHGAEFRLEDGLCLRGPCRGEALTAVPYEVRDGRIWISAETYPAAQAGTPRHPE